MSGPLIKSKDLKDIAGTGGNDSCPGERKKDIDWTVGNDSGLGEDAFPAEDVVAASGPKTDISALFLTFDFSHQQGPSYELSKESLEEAFFQVWPMWITDCDSYKCLLSGWLMFVWSQFLQFGLLASSTCAPARTGYSGQLIFEDLASAVAANYQLVTRQDKLRNPWLWSRRYVILSKSWGMWSIHKPTLEQSDSKSCATPGVFSYAHWREKNSNPDHVYF